MFATISLLLLLPIGLTLAKDCTGCEDCGGVRLNGNCYSIGEAYADYNAARMNCLARGGHLIPGDPTEDETQLALKTLNRAMWLEKSENGDDCSALYPVQSGRVWSAPCTTLLAVICKTETGEPTVDPPPTPAHGPLGCQLNVGTLHRQILAEHNMLRENHEQTGVLCWNRALARDAWRYARYLGNRGGVEHSTERRGQGENIFSTLYRPKLHRDLEWYYGHAVHRWYGEVKYYSWEHPGSLPSTYGHFVQVVWRASRQVGCAHAFGLNKDGKKRIVIICRYSPGAEVLGGPGEYADNVGEVESREGLRAAMAQDDDHMRNDYEARTIY